MLIVLPDWVMELEEKLDRVIKDLAAKNHIDIMAIGDSRAIETGKNMISDSLVDLYWNYKVEDRKSFEKFEKDMKKAEKKEKKKRKKK